MATFEELESSVESSRPIEVYTFTLGTEVFEYTSAEDDVTIGVDTFESIVIFRNQVIVGADQQRRTLNVTVKADNEFASKYIDIVPGSRAKFTLKRFQRDETPAFATSVLLFGGRVQSVKFTKNATFANIAIRSTEAALSRNVPRLTHQGMCGAFLYDRFCGADPALFNVVGTVTSVSGNDITVTGAAASGFNFDSGVCRPIGVDDFRMVLAQSGDVLTLLLPFASDPLGASIQAFAGCDHLIDGDCALVFDRVADYVGFAFVPDRNIFNTGVL